jgi:hypothetical protein
VNQITSWLDSSNVYGNEEKVERRIRSFQNGRLNSQLPAGGNRELLPDNPNVGDCKSRTNCFLAGQNISKSITPSKCEMINQVESKS